MNKLTLLPVLVFLIGSLKGQETFVTRHGQISFFSKTPLENINAVNNEVSSAFNTTTGELGFAVLIKGFHFERALMEEHFNENYMESDDLPKAAFKGKLVNLPAGGLSKDGNYNITAEGDLTIHGVTKKVSLPGTITIKAGQPQIQSSFKVLPKDYNIKIPSLVADKIADAISVTVNCLYEKK